jgi:hypothetical protein
MHGSAYFDIKKILCVLVLICVAAFVNYGQTKYRTYTNDRFAYSIDYPSNLLRIQPPPQNNDGRTFQSKDGKVEMRVWGQHNALGRDLVEEYDESVKKCGSAKAPMIFFERYFVISCTVGDRIFYQKTLHRGDRGPAVFFTFTIEYPRSQRKKFDAIVKRVSRSFKFDPDA